MVPRMVCPAWNTPPTCVHKITPDNTPAKPVITPAGRREVGKGEDKYVMVTEREGKEGKVRE